jgi:hypothetical protein
MSRARFGSALLAAWCLHVGVPAWAGPFDEFPVPEDADVAQVGLNMRLNGIRMSSWELRSEQSLESVIRFYQEAWGTGDERRPGYTLVKLGDARLLTHIDERRELIYTVQAHTVSGETVAQLAVTDLLAGRGVAPETLVADFPRLGGSTVESVLEADEAGWKSRTITLSNRRSVQQNLEQYIQALSAAGWQVEEAAMARSGNGGLSAARGNDRLQLAVTRGPDGLSRTIAVWEAR